MTQEKKIYHYDKEGVFTHESLAHTVLNELIVPANSTLISPPAIQEKHLCVYDKSTKKWNVFEDMRGQSYFTETGEVIIDSFVFELPSGATFESPPSVFHTLKKGKFIRDDNAYKLHLERSLMQLVDSKQVEAEHLILGYKATQKQIERYRDKYERAKAGEFKAQENKIIISKYEAMLTAIRQFVDLIELFRATVDDLLKANQLDKAEQAITTGKTFSASTKPAQIKALFKQLGTK